MDMGYAEMTMAEREELAVADRKHARKRLAYLRREIKAERISQGEIAELKKLARYIKPDDVLLREWAGIPENKVVKTY